VGWDTSNPEKADLIHASYKVAVEFGLIEE